MIKEFAKYYEPMLLPLEFKRNSNVFYKFDENGKYFIIVSLDIINRSIKRYNIGFEFYPLSVPYTTIGTAKKFFKLYQRITLDQISARKCRNFVDTGKLTEKEAKETILFWWNLDNPLDERMKQGSELFEEKVLPLIKNVNDIKSSYEQEILLFDGNPIKDGKWIMTCLYLKKYSEALDSINSWLKRYDKALEQRKKWLVPEELEVYIDQGKETLQYMVYLKELVLTQNYTEIESICEKIINKNLIMLKSFLN